MNYTKDQELAINYEGGNVLVSAGAGSGKTAVLSARVLRKLKSGISVDNLLILTFTNLAAKSMKDKIRNKVKDVPALKEEYEKIDSADITTFDSYSLSILKKYHYLYDLDKNINVTDESILKFKEIEILDEFMESLYEQEDKRLTNIISTYALKDDTEIKNFILDCYHTIKLMPDDENYLNNFDNIYNNEFYEKIFENFINFLKNKTNVIIENIHKFSYLDEDYYKKISIPNINNYEDIKNFTLLKLPNLPKGSSDAIKNLKEIIKNELNTLSKMTKYESEDDVKQDVNMTKPFISNFISLIKEYFYKVKQMQKDLNIYTFLDIEKFAIKILKENEDIRLFYKNKYNEILIDEYQDTSDIQELFISLIDNNNVYMVGDVKQSIYRFRNANPKIFEEKYNLYNDIKYGKRIVLNQNFRSREEVLSDINIIFDYIMDSFLGNADYKKEHELVFGNNSYINEGKIDQNNNLVILNYDKDEDKKFTDKEIEIFTVIKDIQDKIKNNFKVYDGIVRNIEYKDITILMDRSKDFDLYKKIFEYYDIPISIYKDESIKESKDISLIKNILILISKNKIDTEYKYSFYAVSRSYLFNKKDDELFEIFKDNNYLNTNLYKLCKEIGEDYENKSIYEIIKEVINKFDFYNKIINDGDINWHNTVLDFLLDASKNSENIFTITDFINYLEEITSGSLDIKIKQNIIESNSVKIMTIHASKGLEFPLCYYTGLNSDFYFKEIKDKFLYSNDLGFILPRVDNGLKTNYIKYLYNDNYLIENISEKIRLFYVALTRAKEKMVIVTNLKNEKDFEFDEGIVNNEIRYKYRSFNSFLESINKVLSKYLININLKEINLSKEYMFTKKSNYKDKLEKINVKINFEDYNIPVVYEDEKHFSKETNHLFDDETKIKMNIGTKVHELFEYIDFKDPNYNNLDDESIKYIENFKEKIDLNYLNIYHEYEFNYINENENLKGIIDLLLEYENNFVIIDYKLKNTSDEAYEKQLIGYKKYIESITNKKAKTYLYSILNNELYEVSNEGDTKEFN